MVKIISRAKFKDSASHLPGSCCLPCSGRDAGVELYCLELCGSCSIPLVPVAPQQEINYGAKHKPLAECAFKNEIPGKLHGNNCREQSRDGATVQEVMKEMLERRDLSCFFHSAETWM